MSFLPFSINTDRLPTNFDKCRSPLSGRSPRAPRLLLSMMHVRRSGDSVLSQLYFISHYFSFRTSIFHSDCTDFTYLLPISYCSLPPFLPHRTPSCLCPSAYPAISPAHHHIRRSQVLPGPAAILTVPCPRWLGTVASAPPGLPTSSLPFLINADHLPTIFNKSLSVIIENGSKLIWVYQKW